MVWPLQISSQDTQAPPSLGSPTKPGRQDSHLEPIVWFSHFVQESSASGPRQLLWPLQLHSSWQLGPVQAKSQEQKSGAVQVPCWQGSWQTGLQDPPDSVKPSLQWHS